jgi:hypothetical protein
MTSTAARIALLRREPAEAASAVAAASLRLAEPGEIGALAQIALLDPQPANVAQIVGVLHRLRPDAWNAMIAPAIPVAASLPLLRSRQALLNGIALARRRAEPQLLAQLVKFLDSDIDDVPRRAAGAILEVVTTHAGRAGRRWMDDRTAAMIDVAVADAVSNADRRLDEIFLAAAVLAARPGRRLQRLLDDPRHEVLFSIRRVVQRVDHPLVRHNLLRWLTTDPLREPAARSLHRVRGTRNYVDLLECSHLLLQPVRRRAMRRIDRPAQCLPDLKTAMTLPAAAQVDLVRYVRAMRTSGVERRDRLGDCAALPSPTARLNALLGLLGDDSDHAMQLIEVMSTDTDEAVASLAAGRLLDAQQPPREELLSTLEASTHPRIASRATVLAAGANVDAFFERWLHLADADRIAIAHRLLPTRRVSLVSGLRTALSRGGRKEQLAAISLAGRLGVTGVLEPALIESAAGENARVASAAVGALAMILAQANGPDGLRNPRHPRHPQNARNALQRALDHPDVRVQANALEAVTRIEHAAIDRLVDRLGSRDNRLRANAVRAVLRRSRRDGARALRTMLGDADPLHRVSAIWVARQAREGRVSGDLRRIADQDTVAEVRRRAAAAVEWIGTQGVTGH